MSVMSQCYSVVIGNGISATVHGEEVVGVINDIEKRYIYIYQLMSNVQLPGSKKYYLQIVMHSFKKTLFQSG